ncbi:hypothetical protein Q7C36_008512 [Tachysurus vachellii]|uniref:Uncharacterized protein n=1 Tax=Tachysurus vachellii TaxID=175792 RepID=A0AA88N5R8_TACVA|nr:hypothetical protein Q7C36_008512 [Tachysurus vachellii]
MNLEYQHQENLPPTKYCLFLRQHLRQSLVGQYKYQTWIHQKGLSNISMSDVGHSLHLVAVFAFVEPVRLFITKNPAIYWLLQDEGCFLGCGNNDTGLYRSKSLQWISSIVLVYSVCCASYQWNHHSHCSLFSVIRCTAHGVRCSRGKRFHTEFSLNTRTIC